MTAKPLTIKETPMDRNEIITRLIPLVERWTKGYVAKNPEMLKDHYDDLLGEANLKMLATLAKFDGDVLEQFDDNFDKLSVYIRLTTRTAFSDFMRTNAVVIEPHSKEEKSQISQLSEDPEAKAFIEHENKRDVLERLFGVLQDRRDVKIIQAKLDGAKTAKEVSEVTGISTSTIYRRLKVIKSRYDKRK